MDGSQLELRDVHLLRCLMWVLDGLDDRATDRTDAPNSSHTDHGISPRINHLAATIGTMSAHHDPSRVGAESEEHLQDNIAILDEEDDDDDDEDGDADDDDDEDDINDGDGADVDYDDDDDDDDDDYYYIFDVDDCQDEDQAYGVEDSNNDAEFEKVDRRIENSDGVTEPTETIRDTEQVAAHRFEASRNRGSIPTSAEMPIQSRTTSRSGDERKEAEDDPDLCCWVHSECNGRKFATRSNLRRHLREQGGAKQTCHCPRCNASFSRTTARNTHLARGSCNRIRRHSNGRIRPSKRIRDAR